MSTAIPVVTAISVADPDVVVIEPISERAASEEAQAAPIGTGQKVIINTDQSTSDNPVALNITDNFSENAEGVVQTVDVAVATQSAVVAILGDPTQDNAAKIEIGIAETAAGEAQSNAGSVVQVADYYAGAVVVNYDNAISTAADGSAVKVDLNTGTVGDSTATEDDSSRGTIADNAPSTLATASAEFLPDFYIKTGAGDDEIKGSGANDFIRAGAGNDEINSAAGNDIVRTGIGSDTVTLGAGDDILYMTVDQLGNGDVKIITDFDSDGDDKISFDNDIASRLTISGQGTNTITVVMSGDTTATTTFTSEDQTIDADDIEFV